MNSTLLKLTLLSVLIFQAGCDITFKRKVDKAKNPPVVIDEQLRVIKKTSENNEKERIKSTHAFTENDLNTIISYYSNKTNSVVREDMIKHTTISKQQAEKIVVNEFVPRDIQVMPLPLKLNRKLSALPLDKLRVQVGTNIILMNVKTRKILAVIKI